MSTPFDHGLDIVAHTDPLGFAYGPDCVGPDPELRGLDDIKTSLRDPDCDGPDVVYAIVMDVRSPDATDDLRRRNLCYGVVTYAAGRLGDEPIRSQGHVHRHSPQTGLSTPEIYEIWAGRAIILMHEHDSDDPGRCFAVEAGAGEVVVVPPGWVHATISADPRQALTFGAWCDRDYGFVYDGVRTRGGLAWYPVLDGDELTFEPNPRYRASALVRKAPSSHHELGLEDGPSIWRQYLADDGRFDFVHDPRLAGDVWDVFVP